MSLRTALACFLVLVSLPCTSHGHPHTVPTNSSKHLRSHHGKHSKRRLTKKNSAAGAIAPAAKAKAAGQHSQHTRKFSALAKRAVVKQEIASSLAAAGERGAAARGQGDTIGTLEVDGPLPRDFTERFIQAVAKAAKIQTSKVHVLESHPYVGPDHPAGLFEIKFSAPEDAVSTILGEATDPESDLMNSPLSWYLIEHEEGQEPPEDEGQEVGEAGEADEGGEADDADEVDEASAATATAATATAATAPAATAGGAGLDVDTEMPFGELAPFGREDTAKELTEQSIAESNAMVDQLERAEVAEEKRSVFRALTRLRGAAITSFDGVARSQSGNIDQYSAVTKWRANHPVQHLAQQESDVSAWAFPRQSD